MSNNLRDVALIILNYNTPDLTISATRHILEQATGIRVVITDNASTDSSLQKFKEAFEDNCDVSVIETGTNGGYAKGNNFGIAFAESLGGIHYIGVMNPDVELDAKDLQLIVSALKENSSLGLVTGRTIYNGKVIEPNPGAWKKSNYYRLLVSLTLIGAFARRCKAVLLKSSLEKPTQSCYPRSKYRDAVTPVYAVHGCCFFSRLETMKAIGGFDERTFLYWEEDILAEKILKSGLHNAIVRDAWIRHNHQSKDIALLRKERKLFNMQCDYESKKIFFNEHFPCSQFTRSFIGLLWDIDYRIRRFLVPFFYR